jgi:hypothetical protein
VLYYLSNFKKQCLSGLKPAHHLLRRHFVKVTLEKKEKNQVFLEVEVDNAQVKRAVENAYRAVSQQVNIPGFRKGKAPRQLVEKTVGLDYIKNEASKLSTGPTLKSFSLRPAIASFLKPRSLYAPKSSLRAITLTSAQRHRKSSWTRLLLNPNWNCCANKRPPLKPWIVPFKTAIKL